MHSDVLNISAEVMTKFKQLTYLKWHMNKCHGDHYETESKKQ